MKSVSKFCRVYDYQRTHQQQGQDLRTVTVSNRSHWSAIPSLPLRMIAYAAAGGFDNMTTSMTEKAMANADFMIPAYRADEPEVAARRCLKRWNICEIVDSMVS